MSPAEASPRLARALERFEAAHREDPREVTVDGERVTTSVLYHRRVLSWVLRFRPEASEALRLAAACQHIRRWEIPRSRYEAGRRGYRRWRSELASLHAAAAREVLVDVGYDEGTVVRVENLVRKVGLGRDDEVQVFEDAICMVFFESEYAELAAKHDDEKMIEILRRTWVKMSESGRRAALGLAGGLEDRPRRLLLAATA